MENRIIYDDEKSNKDGWTIFLICLSVLSMVIGLLIFSFHHWGVNLPILGKEVSNSSWGTLGDFVGGITGTIVAFVSVRLLVKTLNEQIKSNKEISKNNDDNSKVYKLQLFNESFKTLLDLYKENLAQYTFDNKSGHYALFAIVKNIKDYCKQNIIDSKMSFEERHKKACDLFTGFYYIKFYNIASVHFRLLYRIYQLIDKSNIEEEKKIEIAKIMRCHLPADELLLLRYNAASKYGEKMQDNINTYNLLKHVPFMSLFEMSYLNGKLNENQRNVIDTTITGWTKIIKELFRSKVNKQYKKKYSDRYLVEMTLNKSNTVFELAIIKSNNGSRNFSDTELSSSFEKLSLEEMKFLLKDYVSELFLYSNFQKYNKKDDLEIEIGQSKIENDDKVMVKVKNKNNTDIICSSQQKLFNTPEISHSSKNLLYFNKLK